MAFWTLQNFKSKIDKELDLENEDIVQPEEFVGYVNDGVREVVAEMIKLSVEDTYFHKFVNYPLVANQPDYSLPIDIFANKIKALVYNDDTAIYRIRRLRGREIYARMESLQKYATSENRPVCYALFNASVTAGYSLKIIPTPRVNVPTVTMYYVRQANELSLNDVGTGLIDCPEEFIQFLVAFVKVKCLAKEIGNPNLQMAMQDEDRCRTNMIQTLTDQVEDSDNTIPLDLSHYEEST